MPEISPETVAKYRENGALRVSLPQSVRDAIDNFKIESATVLSHFSGRTVDAGDLSREIVNLAEQDRAMVGKFYKVARRFPSARRISSDEALSEISAQLMGTPFANCCPFVNIRIDLPNETKFLLPAHQDFPYIQDSLNSVTWWIPFDDTTQDMGPPILAYGSHHLGLLKVKAHNYKKKSGSGGDSFSIENETLVESLKYEHFGHIEKGEALVFHTLCVHKSQHNNSDLARINIQVRFSDPFAEDSYQRNYPEGLYLNNQFSDSYPEYVAK